MTLEAEHFDKKFLLMDVSLLTERLCLLYE